MGYARTMLAAVLLLATGLPAGAAGIDAFKCYKAKDLKQPKFAPVTLSNLDDDLSSDVTVEVKKPFLFCSPASVDGAGIANPADHLTCYKTKTTKLAGSVAIEVANVLGTTQLSVEKSGLLCVPSASTTLPVASSGSFLALGYNVAGLPEGISGSHPAVNTAQIGPLLNAYDLVVMQETWKTPDPNPLAPTRVYHEILEAASTYPFRSVSAPLPLGTDPTRPSALVSDGLNMFSRYRFDDTVRQRWSECDDSAADCLSQKGFSMTRMTLPGGATVDVYNLHMEAGGTPHDDALRDQGVTELSTFMNAVSAGRPVLVGGDFNLHTNEEPDSTQFQRLLMLTGVSDVCAALSCPEPGRIDKWLFRSSPTLTITPVSWEFQDATFVDGDGEPLSDHEPLAVRFDWTATN
ncbi:MAG: endonuclease/exonuclease/phosphatase family protein [Candidatus Binatia bacterium]